LEGYVDDLHDAMLLRSRRVDVLFAERMMGFGMCVPCAAGCAGVSDVDEVGTAWR
jgi:hypothetical protein